MRRRPGIPLVNQQIKMTNELAPDHSVTGGHAVVRLQDAATVRVSARCKGKTIEVQAWVENVGAGHKIPSGAPTRRVVLDVSLLTPAGANVKSQDRVYEKTLEDRQGNPVTTVTDSFLKAARVVSDTRLEPEETRQESFTFDTPKEHGGTMIVHAVLSYKFETAMGTMDVTMSEATRILKLPGGFWRSELGSTLRFSLWVLLVAGAIRLLYVRLRQRETV